MKVVHLISILFLCAITHAQVGIGTAVPNDAAVVDINSQISTNVYGGLKLPTVNAVQRALITTPIPDGLMIYYSNGAARCLQIYDSNRLEWQNVYCMNQSPTFTSVTIVGTPQVENVLTGNVVYNDAEGDLAGTPIRQWYRADDALGTNIIPIPGATTNMYALAPADANKFIRYGVIPVALSGASPGIEYFSAYTAVLFKPVTVSFNPLTQTLAENVSPNNVNLSFTLSNRTYLPINITITPTVNALGRLVQGITPQVVTIPANTPAGIYTTSSPTSPFNILDNLVMDGSVNITFTITAITGGSGVTTLGATTTDSLIITDDDNPFASDLFISEYVEGSSNNKYIEIANFTGATINLSTYSIAVYNNGSSTASTTLALSGTLANGSVLVFREASATVYTGAATITAVCVFNGDDALAILNSGVLIDVFGRIGQDPGSQWSQGGNSTLDRTLRRNPGVGPNNANLNNFPSLATEWTQFPQDNVANLGSHTF